MMVFKLRKISKTTGKKAQEVGIGRIIKWLLALIVLVLVYFALKEAGIVKMIDDAYTGFNNTIEKKMLVEQEQIPPEEKVLFSGRDSSGVWRSPKYYATAKLYYLVGRNNVYAFRWNPLLNNGEGRVQVASRVTSGLSAEASEVWQLTPFADKFFREDTVDVEERNSVLKIMNSKNLQEMLNKVAREGSKGDFEIQVPDLRINPTFFSDEEKYSRLTGERLFHKICEVQGGFVDNLIIVGRKIRLKDMPSNFQFEGEREESFDSHSSKKYTVYTDDSGNKIYFTETNDKLSLIVSALWSSGESEKDGKSKFLTCIEVKPKLSVKEEND